MEDDEEDIILDTECKISITFKYDSNNLSDIAVVDNIRYIIESEGFGKIIDVEIK